VSKAIRVTNDRKCAKIAWISCPKRYWRLLAPVAKSVLSVRRSTYNFGVT
jgi:hypothetical protein